MRVPIEDDILPLTNPIVGTSGKVYTELPIPKGTPVSVSTLGYNLCVFSLGHLCLLSGALILSLCGRNRDLWGSDAYAFRPERWLEMDGQVESPVGVYGNLYGYIRSNGAVEC